MAIVPTASPNAISPVNIEHIHSIPGSVPCCQVGGQRPTGDWPSCAPFIDSPRFGVLRQNEHLHRARTCGKSLHRANEWQKPEKLESAERTKANKRLANVVAKTRNKCVHSPPNAWLNSRINSRADR